MIKNYVVFARHPLTNRTVVVVGWKNYKAETIPYIPSMLDQAMKMDMRTAFRVGQFIMAHEAYKEVSISRT